VGGELQDSSKGFIGRRRSRATDLGGGDLLGVDVGGRL